MLLHPYSNRSSLLPDLPRFVILIILAAASITIVARIGALPASGEPRALQSAVYLHADLLYRLGLFLDTLHATGALDERAWQLREAAVASYERQALGPHPNARTFVRLGIIYSKRGYPKYGRDCFTKAMALDPRHGRLYLLLSYIYDPGATGFRLGEADKAHLQQLEHWLYMYTLPDFLARAGLPAAAINNAQLAWQRSQVFLGLTIAVIGSVYLLLGTVGFVLVLLFLGRQLCTKPQPARASLPLRVPWRVIDVAETILVLVFLMLLIGGGSQRLLAALPRNISNDVITALVVGGSYLLYMGITLLVAMWRTRASGRQALRLLGFRSTNALKAIGVGVAGYGVFIALIVVMVASLRLLAGSLPPVPIPQLDPVEIMGQLHSPVALVVYFVLIVVVGPVLEETIFRGFIYPGLRRALTPFVAVLVTSALFATVHITAATLQLAGIAAVGVLLAVLYERTRSVLPCIVAHSLHNCLVFCLVAAQVVF